MNHKLLDILKYKRPHGSFHEQLMITKYIDSLPDVQEDDFGNRIVQIGQPTVMFSCHTDTVHHGLGYQDVFLDPIKNEMFVNSDCLGADDGAGIIVLIEMINAGIEGLYIFHRAEEVGGQGSNYIATETPELLNGITKCIAFDRKGRDSVITHQSMERCCSDEFAEELCQELMVTDLMWFPDDTGSFTDSANYIDLIPECTNLSVGYNNEHTKDETLDIGFLEKFIDILLQVNWDLPVVRDCTKPEYLSYSYGKEIYIDDCVTSDDYYDYVTENPEEAAELLKELQEMYHYEQEDYKP